MTGRREIKHLETRVYFRFCKLNLVRLFLVVICYVFNTASNTNQHFHLLTCFKKVKSKYERTSQVAYQAASVA